MRCVGTCVRGIRTPIIKKGDTLAEIVVESVLNASKNHNFEIQDKDIIGITEAVVGISEGNYVSVDDIKEDIKRKFDTNTLGVVYPILSRNRFSNILKGIARSMDKIYMLLSFPADEVGNSILYEDKLNDKFNLSSLITEEDYKKYFGDFLHPFTGINMVDYYRDLINKENCDVEFIFSNNPLDIIKYTTNVLTCDIHTREKTKKALKEKGANVYNLSDILNTPINNSGFNPKYGLLGSNKSTEEQLKLFPKTGDTLVQKVQDMLKEKTGRTVEVMVYGDGAFKDPVGKIWELADPVVSPAYTSGLKGTPNEIKLKYVADNKYSNLTGDELKNAIKEEIKAKEKDLVGQNISLGTTPRQITDLVGSLCDLTSGSGDKGTPVVYIQGYFDNLANE